MLAVLLLLPKKPACGAQLRISAGTQYSMVVLRNVYKVLSHVWTNSVDACRSRCVTHVMRYPTLPIHPSLRPWH